MSSPEPLLGFSGEEMGEAGSVQTVSLGLDSLNNFRRFWTMGWSLIVHT